MAILPVPASVFFSDFAFDLVNYNIQSGDTIIGSFKGLSNSDEDGNYIGFLISDNPNISIGNTICASDNSKKYQVTDIAIDTYNDKPELLKAYYWFYRQFANKIRVSFEL